MTWRPFANEQAVTGGKHLLIPVRWPEGCAQLPQVHNHQHYLDQSYRALRLVCSLVARGPRQAP